MNTTSGSSAPTKDLTHPKYRPDIDGLRAIAVLSVIGFHAFPLSVKAGFIGVDIFFVISGYLISTIIFDSLERDSFSFAVFYQRRIRRIFPALLIVLFACYVFGWFVLLPDEFKQLGMHIAGGAGFVSNFVLWSESGYFDNAAITKPLLHLWSLGIEEQFYIIWPLLLAFVWKRKWSFITITIVVAVVSFGLNVYTINNDPVAAFYSPFSRFWELMIGGLLAYLGLHRPILLKPHENAQSLLGLVLIILALALLNKESTFPGWWALLPTLGTLFLISAGPNAWLNRNILSNRYLVWIGLISYPLYLWHWPLLSLTRIAEGGIVPRETRVFLVILSIALAWITYRLIEKPIRKSFDIKIFSGLAAGMTLICAFGAFVWLNGGLPQRTNVNELMIKTLNENSKIFQLSRVPDRSCLVNNHLRLVREEVCHSNSRTPDILFVGDSHAMALYSAIYAGKFKAKSILISGHSCPPYANLEIKPKRRTPWGNNCNAIAKEALRFATSSKSISTVVIVSAIGILNFAEYREGGAVLDRESAFVKGNGYFIDQVLRSGKNVVYMVDVPWFKNSPVDCQRKGATDCELSEMEYRKARSRLRAIYMKNIQALKAQYPGLRIFDSSSLFCTDNLCSQRDNIGYLYQDMHHLSIYGSEKVLNRLLNGPAKVLTPSVSGSSLQDTTPPER